MSWMKNMLTGVDNETHDVARVLAVLAFLVGLGLTIYAVAWKGQSFDLTQFGLGIGAMLAALGAALKLKEDTEPK
jgi:hypothetical protein